MATANFTVKPGTRALVVGLGKSGIASIKLLKKMGAEVSVSDASPRQSSAKQVLDWLENEGVPTEFGGHTGKFFRTAEFIIVSPGVPSDMNLLQKARESQIPVIGELGFAAQFIQEPIVAITGTNGKSTVTSLLGELLKEDGKRVFVGGNLGTPLADYVLAERNADIVVVEVSSFQLDTANGFRPDVAILLNISPDHMDRYENFETYAASKMQIFASQKSFDVAIVNAGDMEIMSRLNYLHEQRLFYFGTDLDDKAGALVEDRTVCLTNADHEIETSECFDLTGTALEHPPNNINAAPAILAARLMGCAAASVRRGLKKFTPLAHRLEFVTEISGVRFYDDSKATNVGAVYSALQAFEANIILIAGGRDKEGGYELLIPAVKDKVKYMLVIGEASRALAEIFTPLVRVEEMSSLEEAVLRSKEIAAAGDVVLLSPACASFDMFENYSHRGMVFQNSVLKLMETKVGHC